MIPNMRLLLFIIAIIAFRAQSEAAGSKVLKPGVKLFTDRTYTLTEAPSFLLNRQFLFTSIEGSPAVCTKPGELFALTLSKPHSDNRRADLLRLGFVQVETPEFQFFEGRINRAFVYRKSVRKGDRFDLGKLAFLAFDEGTELVIDSRATEKIADLALIPPKLNTSPLPEYGYDKLDYGMTIGLERTPGGRLWACWVAGGDSPKAYFVLASSDDDGAHWSPPRLVLDSHLPDLPMDRSILVGNLWTDPLGRLWLIFDQSMHMFDGRAGVWATVCANPDAKNPQWSPPRRIWHGVTLNKPTVLSNGEWMLPISLDQRQGFGPFRDSFRELDPLRGANVFVSTDQGETWNRRGAVQFPNPDWHEHMIIERRDNSLWMLGRTRNGIMESTSQDQGRTWTDPVVSAIKHPVARFHIRRLVSGKLLLVKHGDRIESHQGRVQLSAWLSDNDGKSWQGGLVLDERKGISYPDGMQAPDGTIYISYDRNRSTDGEILMARFTEADILARQPVGPKSRLKMLISRPLAREVAKLPTFPGPTPGTARKITIPTIDISGDTQRHRVIARGTKDTYHGHCDTVLLPDGKTMFAAWSVGHAQLIGPLARSDDAGNTWSKPLDVPPSWHSAANTPAIHRIADPTGKARLIAFADGLDWRRKGKPPYPMHQSVSADDGQTWSAMKPNGLQGEVPPKTILPFDNGERLILWSDLPGYVVQSESRDGGRTWSRERRILRVPGRWSQPAVTRSPDGTKLLMLLRENNRQYNSLYSVSTDNAQTWSAPRELPAALTGDRHVLKQAADGRLIIAMRDMAKMSPTYGHYLAWVGRFEDILEGRAGQYRIKLLHNANRTAKDIPGKGNTDCGYSDLELLADGTVIATTYVKYRPGPEKNSVISTRFTLAEMDAKLSPVRP